MDLNFWPGAVTTILFATLTASLAITSGRSAWFVGALAIMIYLIFATSLYLLAPSGTK
jgi:Ca2+:H+ antiporter